MEDNKDEVSTNKENISWFDKWIGHRLCGWPICAYIIESLLPTTPFSDRSLEHILVTLFFGGIQYEAAHCLYKRIYKQLKQILMFMGVVTLVLLSVLLVKMIFKG